MTLRPETRGPGRARTGTRTTRRLSPCYRHPDEPITGICASCLRERLSGLDASSTTAAAAASSSPELRRCRSVVSTSKCEASSSGLAEPRRKSCDVVSARSSLSNLFDVDDVKLGSNGESIIESKNLGLSRVTYTVIGSENKDRDQIRAPTDKFGELNAESVDCDGEVEEGEFKTMKEYIDLEFKEKVKKSKDLKEIAGNFWGAASVFSKKLRIWGQRNSKTKTLNDSSHDKSMVPVAENLNSREDARKLGEFHSDIVGRRRSCDTEPRFSVDGGRISFEEPRASWDGYMIARTIPRLAPMFSVVENGILGNMNNRFENHRLSVDGPMHSIIEDETSSGGSGSGNSNSDSSSSMRQSSFDRSSSVRSFGKKVMSSEEHRASPANVKLVITEKELKDWHLNSSGDDTLEKIGSFPRDSTVANAGNITNLPNKKTVKWRRVRNVFGFKPKNGENKSEIVPGNVLDYFNDDTGEKKHGKLTRSGSVVSSRNSCDIISGTNYRRRSVDSAGGFGFKGKEEIKLKRDTSVRHSSVDIDDGIKPFYMTPLRSSKSGKFHFQNPHSVAGNVYQLN